MATEVELIEMFSTGKKPTGPNFAELIKGTKGPKGDPGAKGDTGSAGTNGAKGDKGDNGTAGKDGFGTQAEHDAIIARLDALETP